LKSLIPSNKVLSEFANFCRQNNLNVGVNATKDAKNLLSKYKIVDIDKAIYYLQFLFISNKKDMEKYNSLASEFFKRNVNLVNMSKGLDYEKILSHNKSKFKNMNTSFLNYLKSPSHDNLKQLSNDAVLSFASLDLSRPVSINYWVERIMASAYIDEIAQFFNITSRDNLGEFQIYELKQRFISQLRDEIFSQLFYMKNKNKKKYAADFLDELSDLSEKDFLHTDKAERKELLQEARKLGIQLAVKLKKQANNRKKGRISLRKTIRKSLSYGGSMFAIVHLSKIKRKPKLIVFCDISGSMALYSIFGLNFLSGILNAFRNIKAYVFIDGSTEVTDIVRKNAGEEISSILGKWNNYVKLDGHSDYELSIESLLESIKDISSSNLHLLVIGDARNNYRAIDQQVLNKFKDKFKKIYWLNPEKKQYWSTGDSIVSSIEPICDSIEEVRNLNQLKIFVQKISKQLV